MKNKLAITFIILGTFFAIFYARLRYELKANQVAQQPVETDRSWNHRATRIAANIFGWHEPGLEMDEILARARQIPKQTNYFLKQP